MDKNELRDDAETALDTVLEEIEKVIYFINQEGAEAFQKGNIDTVRHLADQASQMQAFLKKVQELQEEWNSFFPSATEANKLVVEPRPRPRTYGQRLPRGLRTPESAFYVPILRVLVKIGGKGQVQDVLNQVGELMKSDLNEYDFEKYPTPPHEIRWQVTAQWTRMRMVKEQLLSSTSPFGVWEVTEAGRKYLASRVSV